MADQNLSPLNSHTKPGRPVDSGRVKRAAVYTRVSTADQHPETQLYDLRALAKQRSYSIVREYTDIISGAKAKRPGLEVLDELNHLGIEFISLRENIDTGGPLGRAMVVIVSAIAELEKSIIVERVKAGMRRAKLEGRRIGRTPLAIDREQVISDRLSGMSLTQVAKKHRISRASVCRLMKEKPNSTQVIEPVSVQAVQEELSPKAA